MNNNIDIVVLWVDGNDPAWLKERMKYDTTTKSSGNLDSRFRDWDLMRFWFRGIEKHVNWYHKIFFITWGHIPEWLDTTNPRLQIINHHDYIPDKYLPTFNSNVIELNLHRISDLSENFILFNDDLFVIDTLREDYFFKNNLACDTLWAKTMVNYDLNSFVWHMAFNDMGLINKSFYGGKHNLTNFNKWINKEYGKMNIDNFMRMPYGRFSAFYDFHLPLAYKKSLFQEVWNLYENELDTSCHNRFRTPLDLNQWLFRYWRLAKGDFTPINVNNIGKYLEFSMNLDNIIEDILTQVKPVIILNDTGCEEESYFELCRTRVHEALNTILPEMCSFEKY